MVSLLPLGILILVAVLVYVHVVLIDKAASTSTTDAKVTTINIKHAFAKKQRMRIFAIVGMFVIVTAPYELIPDPIVREILPGAIGIAMLIALTLSGFFTNEF